MNFEKFKKQALLYVIGALDGTDLREFEKARKAFGKKAEAVLEESQKLVSGLALSLEPEKPSPEIRAKLLKKIKRLIDDG